MLGNLGFQACCNPGMTKLTVPLQAGRIRNGYQRLVRVGMAVKALQNRFRRPVGSVMTAGTFRHYLRIVVAQRVVGMKNFMAFRACHSLVPGAVILEPVVMGGVAPGTILQSKRLNLNSGINGALNCFGCNGLT